jgi:hypothetical protein
MSKQDDDRHEKYVASVRQSTREFVEEMMRENERLRSLTVRLENERLRGDEAILELREQVAKLELQRVRQEQQVLETENENRRVFAEYMEIEQRNSNLANLYVASNRLHGTLELPEVLEAIHEIIINLIGSEELAVFELDKRRRELRLLSSFGVDAEQYRSVNLDDSAIAKTALSGEMFLREPPPNNTSAPISSLTTCIPMMLGEEVIGVIAVFRMLPQKPALVSVDRELFALLGSHAGLALHCAKLQARLDARS